ncbi:hypothetical protein FJ444_20125 [Aestuariibacter sp. GS-14]|uniref:hypothetical protein n=1 Tax=Aestuariibacter sp. GS-14 TaxID=2590670 RepID=UPI0011292EF9|nr:hypothetical protein [Aestuariibacter sp. GS-14]TPV53839.1 hypothetical protein FJ444_20125 [Aestuariibacter sp. GS-14]
MSVNTQQELATLSSAPLHGVTLNCSPDPTTADTPYTLQVAFNNISPLSNPERVWQLTDKGERYESNITLDRQQHCYQLHINCEGQGSFQLQHNQLDIDWQANGTGPSHYLQTLGMSLFLELQGKLCLHANTLVKHDQAHLFLAPSRTGKSTLTTLLTTLGYSLTTDDMAALYHLNSSYQVYPSWPKVRLWPDSAELLEKHLTTQQVQQKKVHERFAKKEITFTQQNNQQGGHMPTPVKAMYYLNRVDAPANTSEPLTITPINPSAALIILIQNSMLGDAYRGLGIEKQRIMALAALLQRVPFYRVTYPSGLHQLPDIASILDKLIQSKTQ